MDQVHRRIDDSWVIVVILAAFNQKDGEVGIGSSKTASCYASCSSSATSLLSVIEQVCFDLLWYIPCEDNIVFTTFDVSSHIL